VIWKMAAKDTRFYYAWNQGLPKERLGGKPKKSKKSKVREAAECDKYPLFNVRLNSRGDLRSVSREKKSRGRWRLRGDGPEVTSQTMTSDGQTDGYCHVVTLVCKKREEKEARKREKGKGRRKGEKPLAAIWGSYFGRRSFCSCWKQTLCLRGKRVLEKKKTRVLRKRRGPKGPDLFYRLPSEKTLHPRGKEKRIQVCRGKKEKGSFRSAISFV